MTTPLFDLERDLAQAVVAFEKGEVQEAVDRVTDRLSEVRIQAGERWPEVVAAIRASKLSQIGHQCPFTHHAFSRPRGYPGDALLLDWIYRDFRIVRRPDEGSLAAKLYRRTNSSLPSTAVRWRRQHLAHLIDEAAAAKPRARVLAIAAGHLREADLSIALQRGKLAELVALDQDAKSLDEIDRSYIAQGMPVSTVCAPIRDVISGRYRVEDFDLIYSAGLYDYLDAPTAQRLTQKLFAGLTSGGKLVVTNFLYGTPDLGWMESLMDWYLIYRTQDEVNAFANGIAAEEIGHSHSYKCATQCIGYLSLRKR
jgi:extracellular factor (EF) 3-hydroxypalmitic acid methyl ester biosynthesis protein